MADYGRLWQTMADYGRLWQTMAESDLNIHRKDTDKHRDLQRVRGRWKTRNKHQRTRDDTK